MLIQDTHKIGNKLLECRKRNGMTQAEVAEIAEISERAYADIERGTVNMRIKTVLQICIALNITPDELFTEEPINIQELERDIHERLGKCTEKERKTALTLVDVYLRSI